MIRRMVICVLIFLSDGCIQPYPIPVTGAPSKLVVDGLITDEPGPHTILLSMSTPVNTNPDYAENVIGAQLTVTDDQGTTIQFDEISHGVYQTTPPSWHLELGRSYTLHIRLANGRDYASDTQFINPAGEITSLTPTFKENSINQDDASLPQDSFEMYMDSKGVANTPNLFRWRWTGTYEVVAFPELHEKAVPTPLGFVLVPDPLPCSAPMTDDHVCTCCSCWITEYSTRAQVSQNQFVSESQFNEVFLNRVPVDRRRLYKRYHFEVQQMSVAESVYNFWKLLGAQQSGATNLFQPNAIKIRGNIHSTQDASEEVFGVIAFSAVTRKSAELFPADVPKIKQPIDTIKNDCTTMDKNSSKIKPPFW